MTHEATARSSRRRLVTMLIAVLAAHGVVLLTSEVDGPGAAELRGEASAMVGEAALSIVGSGLTGLTHAEALFVGATITAIVCFGVLIVIAAGLALASAARPLVHDSVRVEPTTAGRQFGRRAFLASASGGVAALGALWLTRGPVSPLAERSPAEPIGAMPTPPTDAEAEGAARREARVVETGENRPNASDVARAEIESPAAAVVDPRPVTPNAQTAPAAVPIVSSAPPPALYPPEVVPVAVRPASEGAYQDAPAPPVASVQVKTAAAPGPREATRTMPGGRNNYVAGAPLVKDLGTGFVVDGTVLETATGGPVRQTRLQIWLNTYRGGEAVPSNRGSVMTDDQGRYRLETSPVVPQFGQPHVHIAYDDGAYDALFLRPVLKSEKDLNITVDFVLGRSAAA